MSDSTGLGDENYFLVFIKEEGTEKRSRGERDTGSGTWICFMVRFVFCFGERLDSVEGQETVSLHHW